VADHEDISFFYAFLLCVSESILRKRQPGVVYKYIVALLQESFLKVIISTSVCKSWAKTKHGQTEFTYYFHDTRKPCFFRFIKSVHTIK
jgi:hypothetical protein